MSTSTRSRLWLAGCIGSVIVILSTVGLSFTARDAQAAELGPRLASSVSSASDPASFTISADRDVDIYAGKITYYETFTQEPPTGIWKLTRVDIVAERGSLVSGGTRITKRDGTVLTNGNGGIGYAWTAPDGQSIRLQLEHPTAQAVKVRVATAPSSVSHERDSETSRWLYTPYGA